MARVTPGDTEQRHGVRSGRPPTRTGTAPAATSATSQRQQIRPLRGRSTTAGWKAADAGPRGRTAPPTTAATALGRVVVHHQSTAERRPRADERRPRSADCCDDEHLVGVNTRVSPSLSSSASGREAAQHGAHRVRGEAPEGYVAHGRRRPSTARAPADAGIGESSVARSSVECSCAYQVNSTAGAAAHRGDGGDRRLKRRSASGQRHEGERVLRHSAATTGSRMQFSRWGPRGRRAAARSRPRRQRAERAAPVAAKPGGAEGVGDAGSPCRTSSEPCRHHAMRAATRRARPRRRSGRRARCSTPSTAASSRASAPRGRGPPR